MWNRELQHLSIKGVYVEQLSGSGKAAMGRLEPGYFDEGLRIGLLLAAVLLLLALDFNHLNLSPHGLINGFHTPRLLILIRLVFFVPRIRPRVGVIRHQVDCGQPLLDRCCRF